MREPVLLLTSLLAVLAALAGCGTETGAVTGASDPPTTASASPSPIETTASPTPSETAAPLPRCGKVWVDGATLPAEYAGCRQGSRTVDPREWPCAFGGPVVTYANRFYAVRSHRVNATQGPLTEDPDWQIALESCRG